MKNIWTCMKVFSQIVSATSFNENSDLSTTYLGRVDKGSNSKLKTEESFPISEHGYTSGNFYMRQSVNYY